MALKNGQVKMGKAWIGKAILQLLAICVNFLVFLRVQRMRDSVWRSKVILRRLKKEGGPGSRETSGWRNGTWI
ncbi:hypothetical protein EON65_43570 [archaeon]|nr:MAG: hypothetical protein EON65_43570 [archaeon]